MKCLTRDPFHSTHTYYLKVLTVLYTIQWIHEIHTDIFVHLCFSLSDLLNENGCGKKTFLGNLRTFSTQYIFNLLQASVHTEYRAVLHALFATLHQVQCHFLISCDTQKYKWKLVSMIWSQKHAHENRKTNCTQFIFSYLPFKVVHSCTPRPPSALPLPAKSNFDNSQVDISHFVINFMLNRVGSSFRV